MPKCDRTLKKLLINAKLPSTLRRKMSNVWAKKWLKPIYAERDARMNALTDASVDEFYTCLLCQSFAPSHVCVVTPERLGLCGAVSWLDAKATKELDPLGPNQPIVKGEALE